MLNCSVCGNDNFPFTSSLISGWASGQSLQMVERCHQCGARVAEKCLVCDRLHPLNTVHCSVYGINIQEFKNLQTDIETRVQVFRELPQVIQAMAQVGRYNYYGKRVVWGGMAQLGVVGLALLYSISLPVLVLSGITTILIAGVVVIRKRITIDRRVFALWQEKNPGILEPTDINVGSKFVGLNFDTEYSYARVPFKSRLINFCLGQAS